MAESGKHVFNKRGLESNHLADAGVITEQAHQAVTSAVGVGPYLKIIVPRATVQFGVKIADVTLHGREIKAEIGGGPGRVVAEVEKNGVKKVREGIRASRNGGRRYRDTG